MPLDPRAYTHVDAGGYIAYADEVFKSRGGTPYSASDLHRDYARYFRVIVTKAQVGSNGVCQYVVDNFDGVGPYALYQSADSLEWDELALCIKISAERESEDDWANWIVSVEYSTRIPDNGPDFVGLGWDGIGSQNNPELVVPEIEWDYEIINKAPAADLDNKAFVNAARQPFKPAPSYEYAHPILVIKRNQLTFDRATASKFAFAVNGDVFMGADPGSAQCFPVRAKKKFMGTYGYYACVYRIRFAEPLPSVFAALIPAAAAKDMDSFEYDFRLNEGFCTLQSNPLNPFDFGKPVPILGPGGTPIPQPDLLDLAGQRVAPDALGVRKPEFIKFRIRRRQTFAPLLAGL